ncbi:uncharacterized protein LOC124284000 [Haliotis rubra]|uniref:uncharacterized protein LOC124284000 n=1 Tax=Haliotis rubra TaxID=36100 RepID=UPI001EE57126|nr:uncharacterized protein LOC124284000 [Haliotis rubra]
MERRGQGPGYQFLVECKRRLWDRPREGYATNASWPRERGLQVQRKAGGRHKIDGTIGGTAVRRQAALIGGNNDDFVRDLVLRNASQDVKRFVLTRPHTTLSEAIQSAEIADATGSPEDESKPDVTHDVMSPRSDVLKPYVPSDGTPPGSNVLKPPVTPEGLSPRPDVTTSPVPKDALSPSVSPAPGHHPSTLDRLLQEDQPTRDGYRRRAADLAIDLTQANLTSTEQDALVLLLGCHRDVFAKDITELGRTHLFECYIDTGSHKPLRQRTYHVNPNQREELSKHLQQMLDNDIIEPSFSPWAAPVLLVKKRDLTTRFCVDFRRLNKISTLEHWPLVNIDQSLMSLGTSQACYYTSLDLMSGYHQVPMAEDSKEKTAFIVQGEGAYQFKVMPFGLVNAPSCFSFIISSLFSSMSWRSVLSYLDDLLIYSKTFEDHSTHLEAVFAKLRMANLRLKPSKCHFALSTINYLGHVISKEGVAMDPAKVDSVVTYPQPTCTRELRSFLGLAGYYRKFIKGYANIVEPLHRLLRKDTPYVWTATMEQAFATLKSALTSAPILAYPDFTKPFILSCDASQKGEDGKEHPVSFAGKSLSPTQKKYSITEKECLAIVLGLKHYQPFLADSHCTVVTDHAALQYLNSIKDATGRLGRWSILLSQYDLHITYVPGPKNGNADALSRRPYPPREDNEQEELLGIDTISHAIPTAEQDATQVTEQETDTPVEDTHQPQYPEGMPPDQLRGLQLGDPSFREIMDYVEKGTLPKDDQTARRVMLEAADYEMDEGLLREGRSHATQILLERDVQWCEAFPLKSKTAKEVAAAFYDGIITRHSTPRALLTDNGGEFISRLLTELCKLLEAKRLRTSPFHPQTNAVVERMNSVIAQAIRVYCEDAREAWPHLLPSIMAGYRLSPAINSTGYSPYFMVYGLEPRLPIDNILQPLPDGLPYTVRTDLRQLLDNLDIARHIAQANVKSVQEAYKARYDPKARGPSFTVGQKVWLKKGSLQPHISRKLQRAYTGPFYIVFAYETPNYLLRRGGKDTVGT